MTYTAHSRASTAAAALGHLGAMTGPVIPALVYVARRRSDPFAATEAAKAANFASALVCAAIAAVVVKMYVPFVGFLGTLALWVVPVVAIYFSLAGFWLARQGNPAHYPFQLKVVKTHD
ncbi:DUF4870 domain-containing protein [Demequina sp. TTPB684]|uniref:DUF4870 domain-containing protein n=1 Tax=unclassified Demequina TaxID=2620311 RepID=UPI001CF3A82E|nr:MULTISPECIES: DUF4870 domain-containing protein [unclassified Demequina]MCB2413317.1 DUF4870 domain-containing protein [Demequina sp. TTPB684]UPU88964.1 DUF4870 domain-containing protein [Demequina sp. TMPB413]